VTSERGREGTIRTLGPNGAGTLGSRPRMDPRIRSRRVAVARRQGRRRLRLLVAGLGVVCLAVAAVVVMHSPVMAVRHLRLAGARHVDRVQVVKALGLQGTTPLADIDPAQAERALEALPWVKRATVTRSWPSTLEVSLVERRAAAQVAAAGGGWAEVDATGRVLQRAAGAWPGLVKLSGVRRAGAPGSQLEAASPGLRVAAVLPRALPGSMGAHVKAIRQLSGKQLQLVLRPAGVVELGPPTQLADKLDSVAAILSQVDLSRVAVISVQDPRAPTLTRR
jgi:cell division protein FtsQ